MSSAHHNVEPDIPVDMVDLDQSTTKPSNTRCSRMQVSIQQKIFLAALLKKMRETKYDLSRINTNGTFTEDETVKKIQKLTTRIMKWRNSFDDEEMADNGPRYHKETHAGQALGNAGGDVMMTQEQEPPAPDLDAAKLESNVAAPVMDNHHEKAVSEETASAHALESVENQVKMSSGVIKSQGPSVFATPNKRVKIALDNWSHPECADGDTLSESAVGPLASNATSLSVERKSLERSLGPIDLALHQWLDSEPPSEDPHSETLYKVYADIVHDFRFSQQEGKAIMCPDCRDYFDADWEWRTHLSEKCGIECKVCDLPFTRLSDLRKHRETSKAHQDILERLKQSVPLNISS